jgi:curli biogenesis system outer membrane secretion channel CsgG
MRKIEVWLMVPLVASILSSCATVSEKPRDVAAPVSEAQQLESQKTFQVPSNRRYKRKIAIGRFTNETNYGRALMTDDDYNLIGKQASDMLASKLIKSEMFLVFERPDIKRIENEQKLLNDSQLIGVDTLIVGSVTEFGRSIGGKVGFLSSTKMQTARAKVDVRLVDVKTGLAFFSAIGAGEASTESGEIAGYGSRADYDATLNDRAISSAISDVIDK